MTFEVVGRSPPSGYAVMWPSAAGPVTVTFSTAAVAFAGMPLAPPTLSLTVPYAGIRPAEARPVPSRLSSSRFGPYAVYCEPRVETFTVLRMVLPVFS